MMCSPDRVNELFRLSVDCEHEAVYKRKNRYGLRWFPSKGAEPQVKWIVKTMVDTARFAIQRLREQTEEARKMALWYEKYPDKLYLPKGLEHLRVNERLTTEEICKVVGLSNKSGAGRWAQEFGMKAEPVPRQPNSVGRTMNSYAFADIEKAVLSMLPEGLPVYDKETDLKYSEALILIPKNLFHPERATYPCMFETLTTDCFNNQLGGGEIHGKSSIFSRMGLLDGDDNPYRITSHQFRHFLNTLAQKKNLDQLTIALWSGRKDVRQNRAYDHVTPDEMLELMRQGDTSSVSGIVTEISLQVPMTREEFMEMQYPTVHTTPYGFCVHNWSMMPCQKHRACIDCTEHKCVKGDTKKTERVRQVLQDAEEQLERDEQAVADGYISADRWLKLNRKRVARLRNLVDIFDDPTVPEGTLIELTVENEYSPILMAVNERILLGDSDAEMLKQARALSI